MRLASRTLIGGVSRADRGGPDSRECSRRYRFKVRSIRPGNIGGMSWSGVSVDEARGILIAPINRLAMVVRLIPRDSLRAAYMAHPDLEYGRQTGTPYAMSRDNLGTCTPPPWGTLVGFDLVRGAVKWQVPLGWMPQFAEVKDGRRWGSVNLGGALVTKGGLVFVAATYDQHLRAFDIETGRELWSAASAGWRETRCLMSYAAAGRQYIVIAAGGHDRLHTTMGDYVLAFTLPGHGAPLPDTALARVAGQLERRDAHWRCAVSGCIVTLRSDRSDPPQPPSRWIARSGSRDRLGHIRSGAR